MFGFLSGGKGSRTLNCFCSFLFPPVNPLNLLVLGKLDVCMSSLQCWRSYMWGSYISGSSMCQTLPLSHIPSPTIFPLKLWPRFISARRTELDFPAGATFRALACNLVSLWPWLYPCCHFSPSEKHTSTFRWGRCLSSGR